MTETYRLPAGPVNLRQSGEKIIHLTFNALYPGRYEKKVILGGRCPALVDMRCVYDKENTDIFYMLSGLKRFRDYCSENVNSAPELFDMILKILKGIKVCGDYLLNSEDITLAVDTVYFSEKDGSAKFLYIPRSEGSSDLNASLGMLADQAQQHAGFKDSEEQILVFKENLFGCSRSTDDLIAITENARRSMCSENMYSSERMKDSRNKKSAGVKDRERKYTARDNGIKDRVKNLFSEFVSA